MPIQIVRSDISELHTDAVARLVPKNGKQRPVPDTWSDLGGPTFTEECASLTGAPGQIAVTGAGNLPSWCVIHVFEPEWKTVPERKAELESLYREVIRVAEERSCRSAAFPFLASSGEGFSDEEQLLLAVRILSEHALVSDLNMYLLVDDARRYVIERELAEKIAAHLALFEKDAAEPVNLHGTGQTFAAAVTAYAAQHGFELSVLCRRANLPSDYLTRITEDADGSVPRRAVLGLAVALRMNEVQTDRLLLCAGFDPGSPDRCQWLTQYMQKRADLDVFDMNRVLFAFGIGQLGQ